jgi:cation diffusion facilitator family transporter
MTANDRRAAERAALVSIAVGALVLALKFAAALRTGSLALLSDALESVVNVVAAGILFAALRIASRPADSNHPYGHAKAEHLSAGIEGALVVVAAATIGWQAFSRYGDVPRLPELGFGLTVSIVATALNLALAIGLKRTGTRLRSPALLADALHVRSDVLTSLAVYAGFGVAWGTGIWELDALLAIGVALHILWAGIRAVRSSVAGLMDEGLSPSELADVERLLRAEGPPVLEHHDLKSRLSGWRTFVELHLVVEGETSVGRAHAICDRLEREIEQLIPDAEVTIHVEPEAEAKLHVEGISAGGR